MSYGIMDSVGKIEDFCEKLMLTLAQIAKETPMANNRTLGVAVEYTKGIRHEAFEIKECAENALSNLGGIEPPEILNVTLQTDSTYGDSTPGTTKRLPEPVSIALPPARETEP